MTDPLCALHGGTRSLILTEFSAAPYTAGFAHFRCSWAYGLRIPRAQEILGVERTVHTAEHLASAVFYLGVPVAEIPRARLFAPQVKPARPYAVLHPAASAPEKTWPPGGFLEVARSLRSTGLEPVFVGASGDVLRPFHEFRVLAGAPLSEIKTLMRNATLFVGNDSGPAHMAAAFFLPLVVIFGASDPLVWAPWKANAQQIVAAGPIGSISPQQVLDSVERLGVKA